MKKLTTIQADVLLLSVAFIWGATFVVVKNALEGITPFAFNFVRFTIAFFFLYLLYRPGKKLIQKKILLAGASIGFVLFLGYTSQTIGLKYTTAANAAFITGLSVIIVPFLNIYFTKRFPQPIVIMGALLAAIGLALLTLKNGFMIQKGDFIMLFCALCFALHIVLIARYATHYDSTLLAMLQIGVVALFSFFMFLVHPTEYWPTFFSKDVRIALALTAIPATALALLVMNGVQKFTTANRTAIILAMEPVFGALTAWSYGGEILTKLDLWGAGLILLGILLVELKNKQPKLSHEQVQKERKL
ncbi:MAG: DMT family transporter [Peptococcia bacterium]|jgi:drug/metabolite transporter (DMT)-like permease